MKIRNTLMATLLAATALTAQAQEEKPQYVFQPHWYIQLQVGGQYTLGETDFGDLLSPNAQIAIGRNFGKVVGARLAVNGWQSRGGSDINGTQYKWKYNFIAPTIQATFNLSNLISGVNPNRLVDVSAFIGGGLNIAWDNDEAEEAGAKMLAANEGSLITSADQFVSHLWDGTLLRPVGVAGLAADFKVSKRVTVGAELSANITSDHYNSKHADNADWYFNGLVGVKIALGDTYSVKEPAPKPEPQVIYRDRIVEKPVEKIVEKVVEAKEKLHVEVFFTISSTKVVASEAAKVQEVANYMQKNPDSKITITGLADKGTGTDRINIPLSKKRAEVVKTMLVNKYGIDESRISAEGKGSSIQPYDVPELNRVSICVSE